MISQKNRHNQYCSRDSCAVFVVMHTLVTRQALHSAPATRDSAPPSPRLQRRRMLRVSWSNTSPVHGHVPHRDPRLGADTLLRVRPATQGKAQGGGTCMRHGPSPSCHARTPPFSPEPQPNEHVQIHRAPHTPQAMPCSRHGHLFPSRASARATNRHATNPTTPHATNRKPRGAGTKLGARASRCERAMQVQHLPRLAVHSPHSGVPCPLLHGGGRACEQERTDDAAACQHTSTRAQHDQACKHTCAHHLLSHAGKMYVHAATTSAVKPESTTRPLPVHPCPPPGPAHAVLLEQQHCHCTHASRVSQGSRPNTPPRRTSRAHTCTNARTTTRNPVAR